MTAYNAWPSLVFTDEQRSLNRWQHRLKRDAQLAASKMLINDCGWKDGDRATRRRKEVYAHETLKNLLTPTGLLMEGGITHGPRTRVFKCISEHLSYGYRIQIDETGVEMSDSHPQATLMLWAAFAMPLLYFGAQLMAAPFYPGYHFATDTASMLGTSVSRHPGIFNTGAILTGIAGLAGAFGLSLALGATARWLRILIAIGLLSNGIMSLKAGLFPMPDPRHATWQFLLFPILITPLLFLGATWRVLWLRIYLLLDVTCLLCLIPYMMHRLAPILPEGTMQRLFAVVTFVPVGVVALVLLRGRAFSDRSAVSKIA